MAESTAGASVRPATYSHASSYQSSSYPYSPHTSQTTDQYRPASIGSNVALQPLNLPSLRQLEVQSLPSSHAQAVQQPGTTLPPPSTYYSQHAQPPQISHGQSMVPLSQTTGSHQSHMMRYPLSAPVDARMMSGGRHKKEIKRRTKTGCLTCRKRRIKCDEQHPKCRNCHKSKRECLGYDPIFKQQQGPQIIHPAPNSTTQTLLPPPNTGNPNGLTPVPPSSYPPLSQLAQGSSAIGVHNIPTSESSNGAEYRYPSDSSLQTTDSYSRSSAYSATSASTHHAPSVTNDNYYFMEHLFYASGCSAPSVPHRPEPLPVGSCNEIRKVYLSTFAPGCDALLETNWFSRQGVDALMADNEICKLMDELLRRYGTLGQGHDYAAEGQCRALECKAVWKLLSMCRNAPPVQSAYSQPPTVELDFEQHEARIRLDVLEALLRNTTLSPNLNLTLQYPDASSHPHSKQQEIQFWAMVGDFVSIPSSSDQPVDQIMHSVRSCLRNLENRDVLYSIMCTRHLVRRVPGFPDQLTARPGAGESDDVNKLVIARDFLKKQAEWHGTTHVVQRVCDMAIRSWSVR